MRLLTLTAVLLLARLSLALRAEKFSKVDTPDNFKQISDVLANMPGFYYYLRFTQGFEQHEYACPHLLQELERFNTIRDLYFAFKVLKELRCKLNPQNLSAHLKRVAPLETEISDASHVFRMHVMVQDPLEQILVDGCKRFPKYLFSDSSKVRRFENKGKPSFDYTALMIRDMFECGSLTTEYKKFAGNMAANAVKDLVDVTKEQSAWPSEDTVYDTIDILLAIFVVDKDIIPKDKLERVIRFISSNLSNDMSVREKNKWNQLVSQLDKNKIQILEVPVSFDFNGCEDTCYLPIVGLPVDSRVTAQIGGKERPMRVQKTNIMMSEGDELKQAREVTFTATNPNYHLVPSTFTIKIRRENRILLTRFLVNSQPKASDLLDSDENDCGNVGLSGNEGAYLHVGFRLRNEENFAFVHLEPHISDFENSAMIHAEFRPDEKLYVATMDFSDYETIRPNSGTYNIWLTIGGLKRQCGQITLTFTNIDKSAKESLTKAYPVELTNIPTFKVDDERFYFSGLYFTVAAVLFAIACYVAMTHLKEGVEDEAINPSWQTVFLAALAGHIATLFYLLLQYRLIDRWYVPIGQLGVLTYLFSKAFLRRAAN